jgi:G:T-mismatch repair DNA endonuclease (very short patch repair protein)
MGKKLSQEEGEKSVEKTKEERKDEQKKIEHRLSEMGIEFTPFVYVNRETPIVHKCISCGIWKKTSVRNIIESGQTKCRHCSHGRSINDFQTKIEMLLQEKNLEYKPFEYKNKYTPIFIKKKRDNNFKETNWNNLMRRIFYHSPVHSSKGELEVVSFLKENGIIAEKQIIDNYEIDIYIDTLNIGFEYNGDFWHANPNRFKEYDVIVEGKIAGEIWKKDIKKVSLLKERGIEVYTIWESDWMQNKEKTKQKILDIIRSHISDK